MIQSKEDLKDYINSDLKSHRMDYMSPWKILLHRGYQILKFQIGLRHYEYYLNTQKRRGLPGIAHKVVLKCWKIYTENLAFKLGFDIPPNTFDKGLNIHHYGCVIVNVNARIGQNCNVQQGVNIGQNYGPENVPTIGDNVYIGPGAKIFGKIKIANGVAIGANAVVNKTIDEENAVVAGVPAKIVGKRKPGLR